jgi:hypothetical protein
MSISYTPNGVIITDDSNPDREPLVLSADASPAEVESAASEYLGAPSPAPDWDGFRRMALGNRTIGRAIALARANDDANMDAAGVPVGEPAASALPVALLEAMNGDSRALAAAWAVLVARGGLAQEDLAPIAAAAEAFNLPADFVAALSPAAG